MAAETIVFSIAMPGAMCGPFDYRVIVSTYKLDELSPSRYLNSFALVVLPILSHQPSLLVVLLTLLTPLRRLIDPLILLLVSDLLGLVHGRGQVFCRRIYSDQFERLVALGHELMLRAGRNNDDIARSDGLIFAGDGGQSLARSDDEDLVDCVDLYVRGKDG